MRAHTRRPQPDGLQPADLLRARLDTRISAATEDDPCIVLCGRPARYYRVRRATRHLLVELTDLEFGMTVATAERHHPKVDLAAAITAGMIDHLPEAGVPVPARRAAQMYRLNLAAQAFLRRDGWAAVSNRARSQPEQPAANPRFRPLILDEAEAAARRAFVWPGTSRQCTVVAVATCDYLRRLGLPAFVHILASPRQTTMHSLVRVWGHDVDPADTIIEAADMLPSWWPEAAS